jgi:hypothetical protein
MIIERDHPVKDNLQRDVHQCIHNPFSSMTVTIGVVGKGHRTVRLRVVEKTACLGNDPIRISSYQPDRSGFYRFGTLSRFTGDEDRLSERRCFLLNATRVCDDKIRSVEERDKGRIVERRDKVDVREVTEEVVDGDTNVGVEVNGIDHLGIPGITLSNHPKSTADPYQAIAKIFTTVTGYQEEATIREDRKIIGETRAPLP